MGLEESSLKHAPGADPAILEDVVEGAREDDDPAIAAVGNGLDGCGRDFRVMMDVGRDVLGGVDIYLHYWMNQTNVQLSMIVVMHIYKNHQFQQAKT